MLFFYFNVLLVFCFFFIIFSVRISLSLSISPSLRFSVSIALLQNASISSQILNELDMLPNSEVVLAQFNTQENKWTLYDVYKVAPNQPLVVSVLGWINDQTNVQNFTAHYGLRLNEETFRTAHARKNLQGIHLRCGSCVSTNREHMNDEYYQCCIN